MGGTHGARASDMGRDGRALRFWLQQKLRGFGLVLGVVSFILGERGVRLPCARCTLAGRWERGGAAEGGGRLAEVMRRSKYIGGHIETFEGFKRQDFPAIWLCVCLSLLGLGYAGVFLGRVRAEGMVEGVCILCSRPEPSMRNACLVQFVSQEGCV